MSLPIYVHIPFCRRKCRYCDFSSFAGRDELIGPYVDALVCELGRVAAGLPEPVRRARTIYLGGGTPSLLSPAQLRTVLEAVGGSFPLEARAEVTIEANPGTVDEPWLRAARQAGVNRISLGVQTLDDASLVSLGRIHSAAEAIQSIAMARSAGIPSVGMDLIYGLPGQTLADWQATLEGALALHTDHLSLYALTIEDDTPLGRDIRAGRHAPPDDDVMAVMYQTAERLAGSAGYEHYEISNWARPGHQCRHNLAYWRNEPYLGFGAGAHSSWPASAASGGGAAAAWRRWHNVGDPADYIARLQCGQSPLEGQETLSPAESLWESAFLALRLVHEGIDATTFQTRFGTSPDLVFGGQLGDLVTAGLVERYSRGIRLTDRGRLLSNEVFVRLSPPAGGLETSDKEVAIGRSKQAAPDLPGARSD